MAWFDAGRATDIAHIQYLVGAWAKELDDNNGLNVAQLLSADCRYLTRGTFRTGPAAIAEFYAERFEQLEAAGGAPTMRHVISPVLVNFASQDRAAGTFVLTFYSSPLRPPATDLVGPTAIADCWMDFALGEDGRWRIASFDSVQCLQRAPA